MSYTIKKSPGQHIFSKPNYIQIEAHRGCTRKCDFCGIKFEEKHLSMSKEIYCKIISDIDNTVKRFSYSLHGEPLLNSDLDFFFDITRTAFPKAQLAIVSNGDVLTKKHKSLKYLIDLFDAGLNMIHIDLYDEFSYNSMIELLRKNKEVLTRKEIKVKNYYSAEENIWSYHGEKTKTILICNESKGFNSAESNTRCFHTWGGNFPIEKYNRYNVNINEFPLAKQCTEPLRYIAISANGNIMLCCSEGSKTSLLGNVMNTNLYEIWKSESFHKYRFALKNKWRYLIPSCYLCNKRCFRVGLYPYWGQYQYDIKELETFFIENSSLSGTIITNLKYYDGIIGINNLSLRKSLYEVS